jgi:hypothetical protein
MNDRRFIRIHNKVIRIDSIACVDFLDSGRAMIFMRGVTQEKQNIPVDPDETVRLRAILEGEIVPETATAATAPKFPENRRWS